MHQWQGLLKVGPCQLPDLWCKEPLTKLFLTRYNLGTLNYHAPLFFFLFCCSIAYFHFLFSFLACDFSGNTCHTFSPLFSCFMWFCKAASSIIIVALQSPTTFLFIHTAFGVLKPCYSSFDLSLNITLNKWWGSVTSCRNVDARKI